MNIRDRLGSVNLAQMMDTVLDEHAEEVKALLREGVDIQELADFFGVTRNSLVSLLKRRHWDLLHPRLYRHVSLSALRAMIRDYRDGMTVRQIASRHGVGLTAVYRNLKREGVLDPWRKRRMKKDGSI